MNNRTLSGIVAKLQPQAGSNRPAADPPYGSRLAALEELKRRLLQHQAGTAPDPGALSCLRRAAEDAASLAWATPYPLLVLPELFAEKVAEARVRSQRQRDIRRRSQGLAALAV